MKVGITVVPGSHVPGLVRRAEEYGFDSAWFIDAPMIFGDVLVSMAAAAAVSTRIQLVTGVTNPVLRSSPMLASGLASLNALAPGRVAMGIGTGFTSTAALGLPAAKLADLARFVGEVRALLRGEGTQVTMPGGIDTHAGFVDPRPPWMDVEHPVPVYVASAGPRILSQAAVFADGLLLGGTTQPQIIAACRAIASAARREAGLEPEIPLAVTPSVYLTDADINLDDEADFSRMRELLGPKSLAPAINFSRIAEQSDLVPDDVAQAFAAVRNAYRPPEDDGGDPATRHIRAHRGYMTALNDEQRPLVTRQVLDATTICGSPDQCLAKLEELAGNGIEHVVLSPLPQHLDSVITGFGERVLPRLAR